MSEYINVSEINNCYGCRACEQVCPEKVISMQPDKEGFLYPVINNDGCIKCGKCLKVCPAFNLSEMNVPVTTYAAQNKNINVLLDSSSGGIFSALAEETVSKGGYVAGCIFDENLKVIHVLSNNMADIEKMRGSKYVQSDTHNIYSQVKECLDLGKYVLFTGTPCQIDGLKRFLRKDYQNLITVDLICHGVPSPLLLSKYIESEKDKKGSVSWLRFRDKRRNGWASQGSICCGNKVKTISALNSFYYFLYYKNSINRICCYSCKYSSEKRVSDITLGDFWGVENVIKGIDSTNGVSACLINTEKGKEFFKSIDKTLNFYNVKFEDIARFNGNLLEPTKLPEDRTKIYKDIENDGWRAVEKRDFKPRRVLYFLSKKTPKFIKKGLKKLLHKGKK